MTTDNCSSVVMPVAPIGSSGYGNGGGMGFGGDASWLIVLFLFAMMGGWGNGGWGGNSGGGGGGGGGFYPWALSNNTDNLITSGFNNAGVTAQLSGIQTSLSNGFANAEVADCNRAMNAMQTSYTNQLAAMNQSFANAQDLSNNLNAITSTIQNCCCDTKEGIAELKYALSAESAATRAATASAIRDVLESNNASTQRIIDQIFADRISSKDEKIGELERQLQLSNLLASQNDQTARIRESQAAETAALYQRLRDCPIESTPIYGKQAIFTCGAPAFAGYGNGYGYGNGFGFGNGGCGC